MKRFLVGIILTILRRDSETAQAIRCDWDMHDWYDDHDAGGPWHMCDFKCDRCGKTFTI